MKPYYADDVVTIYHGDSRALTTQGCDLLGAGAVCSDPPWGANTACNSQRFSRAASPYWDNVDTSLVRAHSQVIGDSEPFDPQPWIHVPCILWGAPHFSQRLPESGGWLIWDKRRGAESLAEKGWPLGEAELAWTNVLGATRVFRNLWSGLLRSTEKGQFHHPTQKPIELMQWCIGFLDPDAVVLDPFMGSGSTLVAAKNLGRRVVGIELEERYCEIAARRCAQECLDLKPSPKEIK